VVAHEQLRRKLHLSDRFENSENHLMPLLNYTTTVPVARTIGAVQALLVEAGARAIQTEYDNVGRPISIAFSVETAYGLRYFILPVNARQVETVLKRDRAVQARFQTPEHAERVAWRIVKDWLEAQLAIIKSGMVTLDQVMLPYMRADNGKTTFELYRDQQLALPAGTQEAQ
jgi:hypothetical protein